MKKEYIKTYRVDKQTLEKIEKESHELGISASEYLRRKINNDILPDDQATFKNIAKELGYMGNNVNQIAHRMNSYTSDRRDFENIEEIKLQIYELKKQLSKLVSKYK